MNYDTTELDPVENWLEIRRGYALQRLEDARVALRQVSATASHNPTPEWLNALELYRGHRLPVRGSCAPVTVLLSPCPVRLNQATTRLLPHKVRVHAFRATAVHLLAISTLNRLTGFFPA